MKNDYSRSIAMRCSTCGGSDFEFETETSPVKCTTCDRVYTREELRGENEANIEANVEEVKEQIAQDIRKDFKKMFRKFR